MKPTAALHLLSVIVTTLLALPSHAGEPTGPFTVDGGRFALSYRSQLDPIVINTIHTWELELTSRSGSPVSGAVFEIAGGMPAHDHGLPTVPTVTAELGDGRYLMEGVRFHMAGYWEITIEVIADGRRETVLIPLQLGPRSDG